MTHNLKTLLLFALLAIANCATLSAKTWRVNPNPDAAAPFTSLTDALASEEVVPGDELLLDPGTYSGNIEITKNDLTITGPGYGLTHNTDWVEASSAALTGKLTIKAHNVTLQGLDIKEISYGQVIDNKQLVNVNSGIMQRCIIRETLYTSNSTHLIIRQNYFKYIYSKNIEFYGANCTICNNIFQSYITGGSSESYKNNIIENNIFTVTNSKPIQCWVRDSKIRNNIFLRKSDPLATYTLSGNIFENGLLNNNNVISNNVFQYVEPDENFPNNEWPTTDNIFVSDVKFDGYFLNENSPAKGKASDGGDCGIFGGATPYVLSGRPANMPHITSAVIPSTPTDGQLSVKLNIAVSND